MTMISMSIELDSETQTRIQRLAEAKQRSAGGMMQDAVKQYVAREEAAQKLRQGIMASFEHYETTGLHLTGGEADAWLARLEAGEDIDPPECHV
jgi:predicted transcriptional regulator